LSTASSTAPLRSQRPCDSPEALPESHAGRTDVRPESRRAQPQEVRGEVRREARRGDSGGASGGAPRSEREQPALPGSGRASGRSMPGAQRSAGKKSSSPPPFAGGGGGVGVRASQGRRGEGRGEGRAVNPRASGERKWGVGGHLSQRRGDRGSDRGLRSGTAPDRGANPRDRAGCDARCAAGCDARCAAGCDAGEGRPETAPASAPATSVSTRTATGTATSTATGTATGPTSVPPQAGELASPADRKPLSSLSRFRERLQDPTRKSTRDVHSAVRLDAE